MIFDKEKWIGNWENFENYLYSDDTNMLEAWALAEEAGKRLPMFQNGVKEFWKKACCTQNKENETMIFGWEVKGSEKGLLISWLDLNQNVVFEAEYEQAQILEKGLEGKPNVLFQTEKESPFRYVLAMEPMPEKREEGGLIRHFHFQFASKKELLIQENALVHPYWYATLCERDVAQLDKCNIILAMHRLPLWESLQKETRAQSALV